MAGSSDVVISIGADISRFSSSLAQIQGGLKQLEGGLSLAGGGTRSLEGAAGRVETTIGKFRKVLSGLNGPLAIVGGVLSLAEALGLVADAQDAAKAAADRHNQNLNLLHNTAKSTADQILRLNAAQAANELSILRRQREEVETALPAQQQRLRSIAAGVTNDAYVAEYRRQSWRLPTFLEPDLSDFQVPDDVAAIERLIGEFLANPAKQASADAVLELQAALRDIGTNNEKLRGAVDAAIALVVKIGAAQRTIDFVHDVHDIVAAQAVAPTPPVPRNPAEAEGGAPDLIEADALNVCGGATANWLSLDSATSGSLTLKEAITAPLLTLEAIKADRLEVVEGFVPGQSEGGSILGDGTGGPRIASTAPLFDDGMDFGGAGLMPREESEATTDVMGDLGRGLQDVTNATDIFRDHLSQLNVTLFQDGKFSLDALKSSLKSVADNILNELVNGALDALLSKIFDIGSAAGGGGGFGGFFANLFAAAGGGIMTPRGPLPLKAYARGGIATGPQLALFGEGRRPEAYVPLPDGRRIPVAMQGMGRGLGGAGVTQNIHLHFDTTLESVDTRIRQATGPLMRAAAAGVAEAKQRDFNSPFRG